MSIREAWRWLVFSLTGRVPGQAHVAERRVVGADEAAGLGLTAQRGAHDDYEATTGHAITCGAGFGAGCQCDTVPVPRDALRRLVEVARWVSRGRSMAFVPDPSAAIGKTYPDAKARRALGALGDAGLLDQFREEEM